MPGDQSGCAGVAFGDMRCERTGRLTEVWRCRAEVVPPSEYVMGAVLLGTDRFGMQTHHPSGQRRGAGRHHDVEIMLDQQCDDLVEHAEIVTVFGRLQQRPWKHVDGDFVDMGVFKHVKVMLPGVFRPLLRIPIAAEQEMAEHRFHRKHSPCASKKRRAPPRNAWKPSVSRHITHAADRCRDVPGPAGCGNRTARCTTCQARTRCR